MNHKECMAMLLAGGQGSRLGNLTKRLAKPAVPFGGKYRIIDFALSNCNNSGIDTVGVLTQYKPLALNSYIGIGSAWDLDRRNGGVFVLPPYVKEKGGEWYKGTADAIYQNLNFIDSVNPDCVLILSGDHIYKMDYSVMLEFHKEKQADATIAVIAVPWEEAGRFGIMAADEQQRITEFAEKPKQPKSNLASMGIYIFNWQILRRYLLADGQNATSSHDFGKDVIPQMLHSGQKLAAYPFSGYWKDVGTVESYWEANMDLLASRPELNIYDSAWRIYSMNPARPPQHLGSEARVTRSLVNEGCLVYGEVDHSVIFPDVHIGVGSKITDSILMPGARIGRDVTIKKTIISGGVQIGNGCRVAGPGEGTDQPILVIAEGVVVPAGTVVTKNLTGSMELEAAGERRE
ncbi:MAG: glucose-1-phosphate adenylyltransferase [Veillonellales bacterium]